VSPLLANVYLHELDRYMERYTALSDSQRRVRRRRQGLANFVYVRYADDFVILCNGTKEQALEMRKEVHDYLRDRLRLELSLEKTKVTHLNEGFDFLGFHLQRSLGHKGMVTKLTIPAIALQRHLATVQAATALGTHADSVRSKLLALNRIISGWCRYYQYTSKAPAQFSRMEREALWLVAHWLARKHRQAMPAALAKFYAARTKGDPKTLGADDARLIRHTSLKSRRYRGSPYKPNPYTTQESRFEREELLEDNPWLGTEDRPGRADLRPLALARDGYRCRLCQGSVTEATARVDHLRPVRAFKRPVDANRLENLQTLCIPCHKQKTEQDRQRESRMQ
jgi:5-methylcytosine-specific restriction endonuclease McrA